MGDLDARGRIGWHPLIWTAVIGLLIFGGVATFPTDISFFLYVFVVAPILLVVTVGSVIQTVIRRRQFRTIIAMLAVLWVMGVSIFLYSHEHPFAIREAAKWLVWSHEYKKQVQAQLSSPNGDFQHMEWDRSGFAGVANNTVYLVFDPTDALSAAARNNQTAKFNDVICKVRAIRRLENHWYAVLFYTDQTWGDCN